MTDRENRPLRIMAVDDETEVTSVICDYFEAEGYEVQGHNDASAALRALTECTSRPDVILLDIMMPKVDGYEFCQSLRAEPRLKDIPVVFLTGKDRGDDSLSFLQSGGQLFVKKPFELQELKDVILLSVNMNFPT
jgi:DNA-binding response OmpR family regulator